uniref:Uncharacterized protein n=1 Tax=Anopheles atroparvus TaxID=41427 RepID=A0AAG5DK61_ANOAO
MPAVCRGMRRVRWFTLPSQVPRHPTRRPGPLRAHTANALQQTIHLNPGQGEHGQRTKNGEQTT